MSFFTTHCQHGRSIHMSHSHSAQKYFYIQYSFDFVFSLGTILENNFMTIQNIRLRESFELLDKNCKVWMLNLSTFVRFWNVLGVGESRILSVEGQVQKLIQEAQDPNRLSKMRSRWAPWL